MMVTKTSSLESICKKVLSYYTDARLDLIEKAYYFAESAHQGQLRSSGEPYITHPTEVAQVLADLHLDVPSIITGLLHDTVEDTTVTLKQIEHEFGSEIAELVDGITKLSQITFRTNEEKQADNFRKMILAMAKDIRVILVKLADRLNNMRTLEHLALHKQKKIAQETLDIYAPIANRLGISWIKHELEDHSLRYLHPDIYKKLTIKVLKSKKDREKYIEEISNTLEDKLREYDIPGQVFGKTKHFYSIYKKMEHRQVEFEQVYDIIAFRILVDNITECYKSLGVMHAAYKPVPGRFKDYIAMSKTNAYQSLHTTVIGPSGERVEIQIRTHEMHQVAEGGIAAHWKYKEGKFDIRSRENVEWINRLLEWHEHLADPSEFLETVKIDLFAEDVFVFTPQGEIKRLPHRSTPLDFAYAVHTDIGNKCIGAKVNGKIVPLKHRLKSGDTIEVLTSPTQTPTKDWLKTVRSSRAKAKIRTFIKQYERDKAIQLGREILEKNFKQYKISLSQLEKSDQLTEICNKFSFKTLEELYISVGFGKISSEKDILPLLISPDLLHELKSPEKEETQSFLKKIFKPKLKNQTSNQPIQVGQAEDILVRFAKCCNPLPGDNIIGFITRGKGVTIHVPTCNRAFENDEARKISVEWNIKDSIHFKREVKIRVVTQNEPGILALMSQTMSSLGININNAAIRSTSERKAICIFDIEVSHVDQLQKLMANLETHSGILQVERVNS